MQTVVELVDLYMYKTYIYIYMYMYIQYTSMVKDTSMGQNVMLFHVLFRKLFVHILCAGMAQSRL